MNNYFDIDMIKTDKQYNFILSKRKSGKDYLNKIRGVNMEKDYLDEAVHEIELRIKEKHSRPYYNTYFFTQPLEEGTYCLITSKVGFIYYRNEMEKKFKKAIKYFEKNKPQYYFFTITTIDGEKRLIM